MNDYYTVHFQAYHQETFTVDPEPFLAPFVRHLSPGCRVMDAGCGSGRDLLWLKRQGFKVVGFERSAGLAALARKNAGCEVIEGDFETYDFSAIPFDAVLLCGALVHVPHDRLPGVLANIVGSPEGLAAAGGRRKACMVYVSLKEGSGKFTDARGRVFYLWQDERLGPLFADRGFSVVDFKRSLSADREGKTWLGYVLTPSNRK